MARDYATSIVVVRFFLAVAYLEHELPLSYGQRVTFFTGVKKVTKETPFRI